MRYQKKESAAMNQMTCGRKGDSRFWYMDEGGSGAIGGTVFERYFYVPCEENDSENGRYRTEGVRNVFTIARINGAGGLELA